MAKLPEYQPADGYAVNLHAPRRFPALYYFAGTGPAGETCAGCRNFIPAAEKSRGRCAAWVNYFASDRLHDRDDPKWWHGLPCIDASTPSCKYWEP